MLLLNMDRFEYLCQFEDVAAICPDTRGMCGPDWKVRQLAVSIRRRRITVYKDIS
jgi:hypothetical protein